MQPHFKDGGRLLIVEFEGVHKVSARLVLIRGLFDYSDNVIHVRKGYNKTFDYVFALLRSREVIAGTAGNNVFLMLDVLVYYLL